MAGCSGPKPILYPNDHLKQVGPTQAELDIQECEQLAEEYVASNPGATVAGNTVVGGAVGGATGAVGGAISGGLEPGQPSEQLWEPRWAYFAGLFQASQPTPVHKSFVNKCLSERGYESIGWE